jgi:hypothetical protein
VQSALFINDLIQDVEKAVPSLHQGPLTLLDYQDPSNPLEIANAGFRDETPLEPQ